MMRRAHHDPVFVREFGVERIVLVECVVPHCGPEIVRLQAQQEFEYSFVELVVVIPVRCLHPTGESGRFVVQEDSAVLDRRLFLHVTPRPDEERVSMHHGYIGPEVPGRNADLFGEIVNPVDGSALVAPGDHQRGVNAGLRVWHNLNQERFPFAHYPGNVDSPFANQPVDDRVLSDRAGDDGFARAKSLRWRQPRDSGDIAAERIRGSGDAREVARIHVNRRYRLVVDNGKTPRARGRENIARLT